MRRRAAPKRKIIPDSKYESELVAKFMNQLMVDGKKSIAEKIVYGAFDELEKSVQKESPVDVFKKVLDQVAPVVEVRSRRIGGATYQVPVEVRAKRRTALAMRWLVEAARKRKEKSMPARLAAELKEAMDGKGAAVKKKEDMHKMAEANKAFSHFRF
ncbi:30S ribosomal protein S7 [SAR86 cluster bacterium]|jgi:small subunit ribosomal protein S7|uniref:Small ribosomal subunit protein uS7 n=1 Tax=SAR86 cluster bacterium TaxID=2030880 RepID=A0A9Q8X252_9GAMM|nr:30S ribosomal protein S7 [bacterium]MEC7809315.1 30S ribosomal protein S7 [Pseudomonadota bacterium]URQ63335.1 30S ribosomal protein S7 [SAR86 cluster bacterium]URQ64391.1 30S ribosomal protein S7 [SAR86 cluster bacterium]|tara:strand:- start:353 stop:823 length:471 start_codon:yes stop_codon:yes gene_type:complete